MKVNFEHLQAAHCENGVTTNLINRTGVQLTEPLVFGIGSGLFYIHIPFLKVNNAPAIAFRTMPGNIFRRTCESLNIPVVRKKFSSEKEAEHVLIECLQNGQAVGCQVGVYYLTYFPKAYRFHFNAHNLIVYGMEGDTFLVSDPVMETVTSLTRYELERVRFAKGTFAPKGQLYYPKSHAEVTPELLKRAIKKGIKINVRDMLYIPGNFAGVKGIKYTANKVKKWRDQLGLEKSGLYLAQLVRMQEEIGTGGGGFRYIYAAFLQQAQAYFPELPLMEISKNFTQAGDLWRNAAVQASGIYKGRITEQKDFDTMADYMFEIAEVENQSFKALAKLNW